MEGAATDTSVSTQEAYDLGLLEQKIERGLKTFVEVGTALMEIRERRLYRQHFGTFEDYCQDRWGFNRHRASQLIAASEVAAGLPSELVKVLTNDHQARELAKAPPEARPQIIQKVAATGKVTATKIREAVAEPKARVPISNPPPPSGTDGAEKPDPVRQFAGAMKYAIMAISDLEKIDPKDKERTAALAYVKEWIERRL